MFLVYHHNEAQPNELAGIPTVCDVALALYSKLLPDRVQGAGQVTRDSNLQICYYFAKIQACETKFQAFRRLVSQLALLLGPLWAPATLNNPMLMLAVPLGCRLHSHIILVQMVTALTLRYINLIHIYISRSSSSWCNTILRQLEVDEGGGGG